VYSARIGRLGSLFGKIPCRFPAYQGICTGAEFDPDCAHRQPVHTAGDYCAQERVFSPEWALSASNPKRETGRFSQSSPFPPGILRTAFVHFGFEAPI